jgi:RNase adapter protein RapZ
VSEPRSQLIIVSGLSGSGKTVALRTLEDLDFYCIDNLPASLLPQLAARLKDNPDPHFQAMAVGIDARNLADDLKHLPAILDQVADTGIRYEIFFLEANDSALIKRFSETRRRHPLTEDERSLAVAIATERTLLADLRSRADLCLDTSEQNVHQLRRAIWTRVKPVGEGWSLLLESFAFKRGVPSDADFVFDVRCLPNPYWDVNLRPLTGRDLPIRAFLGADADVSAMLADIQAFLARWLPRFEHDQRSYITVGIGCTGGKHRSVYIVERLAEHFRETRDQVLTFHRELQ